MCTQRHHSDEAHDLAYGIPQQLTAWEIVWEERSGVRGCGRSVRFGSLLATFASVMDRHLAVRQ